MLKQVFTGIALGLTCAIPFVPAFATTDGPTQTPDWYATSESPLYASDESPYGINEHSPTNAIDSWTLDYWSPLGDGPSAKETDADLTVVPTNPDSAVIELGGSQFASDVATFDDGFIVPGSTDATAPLSVSIDLFDSITLTWPAIDCTVSIDPSNFEARAIAHGTNGRKYLLGITVTLPDRSAEHSKRCAPNHAESGSAPTSGAAESQSGSSDTFLVPDIGQTLPMTARRIPTPLTDAVGWIVLLAAIIAIAIIAFREILRARSTTAFGATFGAIDPPRFNARAEHFAGTLTPAQYFEALRSSKANR